MTNRCLREKRTQTLYSQMISSETVLWSVLNFQNFKYLLSEMKDWMNNFYSLWCLCKKYSTDNIIFFLHKNCIIFFFYMLQKDCGLVDGPSFRKVQSLSEIHALHYHCKMVQIAWLVAISYIVLFTKHLCKAFKTVWSTLCQPSREGDVQ